MKVLFVGPSLPDAASMVGADIDLRGPATQGDVIAAVEDGATVIGLIDGGFEYTAPVWHKEILYGLSKGVTILGAASMGALRAAECEPFGMIGIGRIFEDYRDGLVIDDADVALIHTPSEMNYRPLTVPMVNVNATLTWVVSEAAISTAERDGLERSARDLFFKHRTWKRVVASCQGLTEERKSEIGSLLAAKEVDQKRLDAVQLVECLKTSPAMPAAVLAWTFHSTSIWREMLGLPHG